MNKKWARRIAAGPQPYGIGSRVWPGLAKLMEEMGELQQVLGKIMACEPQGEYGTEDAIYWNGQSLRPQLVEELGDVRAALIFFCNVNRVDRDEVHTRADVKLEKFMYWHNQQQDPGGYEGLLSLTDGKE